MTTTPSRRKTAAPLRMSAFDGQSQGFFIVLVAYNVSLQFKGTGSRAPIGAGALVPRPVDEAVLGDPGHHRPQLLTDLFDIVLRGAAA
jgi:hypothetical protein